MSDVPSSVPPLAAVSIGPDSPGHVTIVDTLFYVTPKSKTRQQREFEIVTAPDAQAVIGAQVSGVTLLGNINMSSGVVRMTTETLEELLDSPSQIERVMGFLANIQGVGNDRK